MSSGAVYSMLPLANTGMILDMQHLDVFGNIETSEQHIHFEANFVETDKALIMTSGITAGGTVTRDATRKSMMLGTTTASGDRAAYQSREYHHYVSGFGGTVLLTGNMSPGQTNLLQEAYYGDADNGKYFRQDGSALSVGLRSSTTGSLVDTNIVQADWNGGKFDGTGDKLDGTGASGIDIDFTKQLIYIVRFQWLGSGVVEFSVDINQKRHILHTIRHSNIITGVYSQTGSLPVGFSIENTGVIGSAAELEMTCVSVKFNSPTVPATQSVMVDNDTTTRGIVSGSFSHVLSIRLKSGNKRATLIPEIASLMATSNTDILYRVLYNPTVTGGSWVSAGTNSIAEYNRTATGFSGGHVMAGGYTSKNIEKSLERRDGSFLKITSDFAGNSGNITIVARSLSASPNVLGTIIAGELF